MAQLPAPGSGALRRRAPLLVATVLGLAVLLLVAGWPPDAPPAPPPGAFAFAVLGDAPYYPHEVLPYRRLLRQLDESRLRWILHVGDLFGTPCSERLYRSRLAYLERRAHPVVYTPGDNEWADCHLEEAGGYAPLERLEVLRGLFFAEPRRALGGGELALESQGTAGAPEFAEFVENVLWVDGGIVFATVHLVGSHNATALFPTRTRADDEATRRRTLAAASWLRGAFARAREIEADGVFVAFHAELSLDRAPDDPTRVLYEPFLRALEEEALAFDGRPVVIAHGDLHDFVVDRPLRRRSTGEPIDNVTRLQVPGSPTVGWVLVTVTPGDPPRFEFEEFRIPRWRF